MQWNNNQQDNVATAGGDRQQQYADKTRMAQQGDVQHRVVHPPAAHDKRHEQPPDAMSKASVVRDKNRGPE
jgi:hypothetical protein